MLKVSTVSRDLTGKYNGLERENYCLDPNGLTKEKHNEYIQCIRTED